MSGFPDIQPREDATVILELAIAGNNTQAAIDDLGRLVTTSQHIQGVLVQSKATENSQAFVGGDKGGYFEEMATILARWNSPEEIQKATLLTVSDERLAEIANLYTLPEYLLNPDNEIDAAVSYVIKGLVGYSDDTDISLEEEAARSTLSIMASPGLTTNQMLILSFGAEDNKSNATQNALYRAKQVEAMDHILRFLIVRDMRRPYSDGSVYMSIDYDFATGPLGDAFAIVNGANGWDNVLDDDDHRLSRGMLSQKTSIIIRDGEVRIGSQNTAKLTPIWPQSALERHQLELQESAEKQAALEAERLQAKASRELEQKAKQSAEFLEWQADVEAAMLRAEEDGYQWIGILPTSGPLGEPGALESYIQAKYPGKEFMVVRDTAIIGGKTARRSANEVTVYIK